MAEKVSAKIGTSGMSFEQIADEILCEWRDPRTGLSSSQATLPQSLQR